MEIDNDNGRLDIYNWGYGDIPLSQLNECVDALIAQGKTKVRLDLSWGYYNDIDGIDLVAEV